MRKRIAGVSVRTTPLFRWRFGAKATSAQATVEAAVVLPVLIAVALISYNVMVFASAVARFDRIAPDIVLAHVASPVSSQEGWADQSEALETAAGELRDAIAKYDIEVTVEVERGGSSGEEARPFIGTPQTFRCTMRMQPWPSGFSIAGIDLGLPALLVHERTVTLDPWRPGVIV